MTGPSLLFVSEARSASSAGVTFQKEGRIGTLVCFEAESGCNLEAESLRFRPISVVGLERASGCNIGVPKTGQSKVQVFQNFFYV